MRFSLILFWKGLFGLLSCTIILIISTNITYSGIVNVEINNNVYPVKIVNGKGNTSISNLSSGSYIAVAKLTGNTIFKDADKTIMFNITDSTNPNLYDPNLNVIISNFDQNSVLIEVTTNSIYSGMVDVKINDNSYSVSVVNGKGSIITKLSEGNYIAVAKLNGNNIFKDSVKSIVFNVTGNNESVLYDPELTLTINDYYVDSFGTIIVTTNSIYTGMVDVEINGRVHHINVVNGKGNMTIDTLAEGSYVAVAKFSENNIFKSSTKSVTFTVIDIDNNDDDDGESNKEDDINLFLYAVKIKKSAKKLIIKATLKINNKAAKGVKLIFKFKGKTYYAKTNKKGIAKITIKKSVLKKLKVGKKVKYQAIYKNITKTKSAKVKR